jgi:hypothetical protein
VRHSIGDGGIGATAESTASADFGGWCGAA